MSKNRTDRNLEAILRLMKLTLDDEIQWEETNTDSIELQLKGDFEVLGKPYKTTYKDKIFRIFKCRRKIFDFDIKENRWEYYSKIEVINEKKERIWAFPYDPYTDNLYETISFSKAGGREIYDMLLAED